jgi:DNA-binding CsgD family transcriptional regulator
MAASAHGTVCLAQARAQDALAPLRQAAAVWRDLDAPYEVARVAVATGRACRALGDEDGARLEWEAAARVFRQFGAAPALAELDSLTHTQEAPIRTGTSGLSPRELEVLLLIAKGHTNRMIAHDLAISEKTVARHVSNIFTKLDLTSRAAATAFAFTHGLMSGSSST